MDVTDVVSQTTDAAAILPTEVNAFEEALLKIDEMVLLAAYLKKVVKPLLKKSNKGKRARPTDPDKVNRNGFQAPVKMAPVLTAFLNKEYPDRKIGEGTTLPRTEVTQLMTTYIKAKDLQIPENRKNFKIDASLAKVFGVDTNYVSNWFEMQKFMRNLLFSVKDDGSTSSSTQAPAAATPAATPAAAPAATAAPAGKRIKKGGN
jgi:hypothetical protein